MRGYGQFCPVAKTAEVFCQRWTALIIRDLGWGSTRFSELKRGVPLMSPTLLSQRLKSLEAEGIVERRGQGRDISYHLTEAGRDFAPIIEAMGRWGQEWTRRELAEDEIDLDLLLWGIEAHDRPDAFGRQPVAVALDFTDLPGHKRHWWYLNAEDRCQLCVDDPGMEPALWLAGSLPDFIRLYRGDLTVPAALDGRIEALGSRADLSALGDWLNLSPLSRIASRRAG
jgi:DNA-binding HxlR family transcriptional regulator